MLLIKKILIKLWFITYKTYEYFTKKRNVYLIQTWPLYVMSRVHRLPVKVVLQKGEEHSRNGSQIQSENWVKEDLTNHQTVAVIRLNLSPKSQPFGRYYSFILKILIFLNFKTSE
jgi:hypothetical protein